MNRLIFLLLLATCQQICFAAVYKCEHEGGKVAFQSSPCTSGRGVPVAIRPTAPSVTQSTAPSDTPSASASGDKKVCPAKNVRINFANMPVKTTLHVLADFSGNKLVADPSISGSGAFSYDCVPWETALQDIASRYSLAIKVENGTIFATKR